MEERVIAEQFAKGYDCSQVVVSHFAAELGISEELANKAAACFGGGMFQADTCGVFTGALIVIGLKYGHFDPDRLQEQKNVLMAKSSAFRIKFFDIHPTCNCRELVGYDVSTPEGLKAAVESGRMMSFCPKLVKEVIGLLEENSSASQ